MAQATHQEQHFTASQLVSDIVIGMSDGLTVPFALAAGLSGAVISTRIIYTAGIAEIIAGSIAMGLGGYLAGRTEVDHYKTELAREYDEVERFPDKEKQEVMDIFAGYGLSRANQEVIVKELSQNKDTWVNFMMKFELGLEKPAPARATKSALTIGTSYIAGGLIPLAPYFFITSAPNALKVSALCTLLCLFVFGYFKSRFTGQNPMSGGLRVMVIGAIAAGAAYILASFVK